MTLNPEINFDVVSDVVVAAGYAGLQDMYGEPSCSLKFTGTQLPPAIYNPLFEAVANAVDAIEARKRLPSKSEAATTGGMETNTTTGASSRDSATGPLQPPVPKDHGEAIDYLRDRAGHRQATGRADLEQLDERIDLLKCQLIDLETLRAELGGGPTKTQEIPPPPGVPSTPSASRPVRRRAPAKAKRGKLSLAKRVLALIGKHPGAKSAQIAAALRMPVPRIASTCNVLKRAKKIKKHGQGRAVTWTRLG